MHDLYPSYKVFVHEKLLFLLFNIRLLLFCQLVFTYFVFRVAKIFLKKKIEFVLIASFTILLASLSVMGFISMNGSRFNKLVNSFSTATSHSFMQTFLPSFSAIWLNISTNHFECNGFSIENVKGTSIYI